MWDATDHIINDIEHSMRNYKIHPGRLMGESLNLYPGESADEDLCQRAESNTVGNWLERYYFREVCFVH